MDHPEPDPPDGTRMSVIELGDLSSPTADPPPPSSRPAARFRGWPLVVALLCALALGASAAPPPPLVRQLWTTGATEQDGFAIGADAVYVVRRTGMTAYDLATGAVRWRRASPLRYGDLTTMQVTDGMVLLGGPPEFVTAPGYPSAAMAFPTELIALDAATGADRWRSPGEVFRTTPDAVLLADRDAHGELHTMRMVGARDGVVRWTRPLTRALDLRPGPGQIVATAIGEIATYRYDDGTPIATRPIETGDDWQNSATLLDDDRLFVTRADPRGATITAYRLDDLSTLWSRRTLRGADVTGCGPVICLSSGAELSGLDAATGTTRWSRTGWAGVDVAGSGRLLAYSTSESPEHALMDAATGQVLGRPAPGWPTPTGGSDGTDTLIRASTTDPDRSVVSRIDSAAGRIIPIGTIASPATGPCSGGGRFLLCRRPDALVVTALG
ncbi:outer membrane protein assembly factor BamB family protein [Actinoplanes sp. HUAS TT8]|uniref:outer membrane protein assembly factor BamB family protein n=1 Tax=Actinoplanes sp. HUAS TT8 TaxID=3447453 RepID=UPI003F52418F